MYGLDGVTDWPALGGNGVRGYAPVGRGVRPDRRTDAHVDSGEWEVAVPARGGVRRHWPQAASAAGPLEAKHCVGG